MPEVDWMLEQKEKKSERIVKLWIVIPFLTSLSLSLAHSLHMECECFAAMLSFNDTDAMAVLMNTNWPKK